MVRREFRIKIQTEILCWIIDFIWRSRTLISSTLTAAGWLEVPRWVKWLTLVASNRWKSRHERCVVLEARRRSPNKRFWGKSIALVCSGQFNIVFDIFLMLMTKMNCVVFGVCSCVIQTCVICVYREEKLGHKTIPKKWICPNQNGKQKFFFDRNKNTGLYEHEHESKKQKRKKVIKTKIKNQIKTVNEREIWVSQSVSWQNSKLLHFVAEGIKVKLKLLTTQFSCCSLLLHELDIELPQEFSN